MSNPLYGKSNKETKWYYRCIIDYVFMNVSVSITDLPVFAKMEYLFAGLAETGADGVEIVSGVKSRWRWKKIAGYAEKYNLPIRSIHQPPWSGLNIYFDEANIRHAIDIGVRTFVFHPLTRYSFSHPIMIAYFARLQEMQKKHNVKILLENMPMPNGFRRMFGKQVIPYLPDTYDFGEIQTIISQYGLGFNLDISHAFVPEPQKEPWFDSLYPYLGNIHLSSFKPERDHLPLYMGNFNSESFLKELKKRKYNGLITLEIFYPRMVLLKKYDFEAIKRSVEIVKGI
jgi:sugar phosphate isomerase/epimerase